MKPPSRSNRVVSSIFTLGEAGTTVMAQTQVSVHRASRLLSYPRKALELWQKRYLTVPRHVILNLRCRQDPLNMATMQGETKCLMMYFLASISKLIHFLCSSNLPAPKRVRRGSHTSLGASAVEVPHRPPMSSVSPKPSPTSPETPTRKRSSVCSIKPPSSRCVQCDTP